MVEAVDRRRGNVAPVSGVCCWICLPDLVDRPRPSVEGSWFFVKLPSATDVDVVRTPRTIIPHEDEGWQWRSQQIWGAQADWPAGWVTQGGLPGNCCLDDGKGMLRFNGCSPEIPDCFAMCGIRSICAGFDFKDFCLTDKEEYPNAMLILDETSSIIVPEIISIHVGFDFKDFGLTEKEEYPNATCFPDKTVPEIIRKTDLEAKDGRPGNICLDEKVLMMDGAGGSVTGSPMANPANRDNVFILDSGAAVHATGNLAILCHVTSVQSGRAVRAANGHTLPIRGSGSVNREGFTLNDVLYIPGLARNVVSVSKLGELDYSVEFTRNECLIKENSTGELVGRGRLVAGLFELDYLQVPLDRAPVALGPTT